MATAEVLVCVPVPATDESNKENVAPNPVAQKKRGRPRKDRSRKRKRCEFDDLSLFDLRQWFTDHYGPLKGLSRMDKDALVVLCRSEKKRQARQREKNQRRREQKQGKILDSIKQEESPESVDVPRASLEL